jgi:hypothetical protein
LNKKWWGKSVLQIKIAQNYQPKQKPVTANTNTLSSNCKLSGNGMAKNGYFLAQHRIQHLHGQALHKINEKKGKKEEW